MKVMVRHNELYELSRISIYIKPNDGWFTAYFTIILSFVLSTDMIYVTYAPSVCVTFSFIIQGCIFCKTLSREKMKEGTKTHVSKLPYIYIYSCHKKKIFSFIAYMKFVQFDVRRQVFYIPCHSFLGPKVLPNI